MIAKYTGKQECREQFQHTAMPEDHDKVDPSHFRNAAIVRDSI